MPHVPPPDAKNPPAVGRLYAGDGRPLTDLYGSGPGGPGDGGPRLREPYKSLPSLTGHVEGHAAAIMRDGGIREAILYINMRPCKGPDGCHENLRAVLPVGSTLTVHRVYASGSTKLYQYPGTGEGLSDEQTR